MRKQVVSTMRVLNDFFIKPAVAVSTVSAYSGIQDARNINTQAATDETIKDLIKADFNYAATLPTLLMVISSGIDLTVDYIELEADKILSWRENLALFGFALPNLVSIGYVSSKIGHEKNTLASTLAGTVGTATPQAERKLLLWMVKRHQNPERTLLLNEANDNNEAQHETASPTLRRGCTIS